MKTKMVSYTLETLPRMTDQRAAQLRAMRDDPNFVVDTSDIPEWTREDFKDAVRGRFYRPVKEQITTRLDADVIAWLKKEGKGYQSRMNAILRREMLASLKTTPK